MTWAFCSNLDSKAMNLKFLNVLHMVKKIPQISSLGKNSTGNSWTKNKFCGKNNPSYNSYKLTKIIFLKYIFKDAKNDNS